MLDEILTSISSIKSKREKLENYDEACVKQAVILPLLQKLGWNPSDPDEVTPEYGTGNNRVDFSLRSNKRDLVFLEVKRGSEDLERHSEQVLKYAFEKGVELAVLTNGMKWLFYLPMLPGVEARKRKFCEIDLVNCDEMKAAEEFVRFLGKENVVSRNAVNSAHEIRKKQEEEAKIEKALPEVWKRILEEGPQEIINLVSEKVKEICGVTPDETKVKNFLKERAAHTYFPAQESPSLTSDIKEPKTSHGRSKRVDALPQEEYYIPILEILVENGGKLKRKDIINAVREKMKSRFSRGDEEHIESGVPRWQRRAEWAIWYLEKQGLLQNIQGGIKEITEKGKKYLEKAKRQS